MPISDVSNEIRLPGGVRSLFYPGAFADFEVIRYLLRASSVSHVYYCDYLNDENSRQKITDALFKDLRDCQITHVQSLYPNNFGRYNWNSFWYQGVDQRQFFGQVENSYINHYLIKRGRRRIHLYYFGTEAVGTYEVLLSHGYDPEIVVLQNHGLGCLWTAIGGEDLLYQAAYQKRSLPYRLMVGPDTAPWPGYTQSSDFFGEFGLHQYPRRFFKRARD